MKKIFSILSLLIVFSGFSQEHSGGIVVPTGFKIAANAPVDDRFVVADSLSLYDLPNKYDGMFAVTLDEEKRVMWTYNEAEGVWSRAVPVDDFAKNSDLAEVAFSGSYDDLTNKPDLSTTIPDWEEQTYKQGDLVAYDNSIWRSEYDNNDQEPSDLESTWEVIEPEFDHIFYANDGFSPLNTKLYDGSVALGSGGEIPVPLEIGDRVAFLWSTDGVDFMGYVFINNEEFPAGTNIYVVMSSSEAELLYTIVSDYESLCLSGSITSDEDNIYQLTSCPATPIDYVKKWTKLLDFSWSEIQGNQSDILLSQFTNDLPIVQWSEIQGNQSDINLIGFKDGFDGMEYQTLKSDLVNLFSGNITEANGKLFITYGNFEDGYTLEYTEDLENWTEVILPSTPNQSFSIAYNDGVYIIGINNEIYSSEDLENWTLGTNPCSCVIGKIFHNGNVWLMYRNIPSSSSIYYSIDGESWTAVTGQPYQEWRSIKYFEETGQTILVGRSATNNLGVSNDGINWTFSTIPKNELFDIEYNGSTYVVTSTSSGPRILVSENLSSWTEASSYLNNSSYFNVVWHIDRFIVLNNHNSSENFEYSYDGDVWFLSDNKFPIGNASRHLTKFNDRVIYNDNFASEQNLSEIVFSPIVKFENVVNEYRVNGTKVEPVNKILDIELNSDTVLNNSEVEGIDVTEALNNLQEQIASVEPPLQDLQSVLETGSTAYHEGDIIISSVNNSESPTRQGMLAIMESDEFPGYESATAALMSINSTEGIASGSTISAESQADISTVRLEVGTLANSTRLLLRTDMPITVVDNLHQTGIKYIADYSANFTDRSLVDKEYVDNAIPTKTSDLTNDGDGESPFITEAEADLKYVESSELSEVAFSNSYNDLDDLPTIPDQVNLIEGSNISITGTYPNLTISASGTVGTDLAQGTRTSTTVPITSSTGSSATLQAATTSLAGVMSAADKAKLDGLSNQDLDSVLDFGNTSERPIVLSDGVQKTITYSGESIVYDYKGKSITVEFEPDNNYTHTLPNRNGTYAMLDDIPSLSGYATEAYVANYKRPVNRVSTGAVLSISLPESRFIFTGTSTQTFKVLSPTSGLDGVKIDFYNPTDYNVAVEVYTVGDEIMDLTSNSIVTSVTIGPKSGGEFFCDYNNDLWYYNKK